MKLFLIFTLSLISIIGYSQTTYYVSNSGNDGAAGTSIGTAWKTFDNINSGTFSAGDSILFEKGGLWRQEAQPSGYGAMIVLTEDGSEDNHIAFSSYGTGEIPKLYGSAISLTYANISGNIYRCNEEIPYDPNNLGTFGGTDPASLWFMTNDTVVWGDTNSGSVSGLDANYEWYWQNDSIYFYYDATIGDIDSIEVTQNNGIFQLDGNYYTVDGLEMKYFKSQSIGSSNENTRYGMIVRNCELAYSSIREGVAGYGIDLKFSDMLIESNISHDNGRRNLSFNLVTSTSTLMRDVIIQDNICFNGFHTLGIDMATTGSTDEVKNIVIRRNKISLQPTGNDENFPAGAMFIYNTGGNSDFDSIFIYNNEMLNLASGGITLFNVGTSFIVNNTFTSFAYDVTGTFNALGISGSDSRTTIMNNIYQCYPSASQGYIFIRGDATRTNVQWDTVDYNMISIVNDAHYYLFDAPSTFAEPSYFQSEWSELVSEGWEVNSPVAPSWPHFADSLYSSEIRSTSPAIGAATPISFVTTDINGNPRDATNPDAGAWEFQAIDSTATDIITFSIPNQVSSTVTTVDSSVVVTMPYGTNVASLTAIWTMSEGATSVPVSTTSQDYTTPLTIDVTSLKSNSQEWTVTVTVQAAPVEPTYVSLLYSDIIVHSNVILLDDVLVPVPPVPAVTIGVAKFNSGLWIFNGGNVIAE